MTISEVFEHLPTLARHTFLTIPVKGNPAVEVLKNLQSRVIAKIRDLAELEKDKYVIAVWTFLPSVLF